MGFLDYDVEICKIIVRPTRSSHSTPTTDAPCEPEDTSRPNKLRSSASSPARWTDQTRSGTLAPHASMTTATICARLSPRTSRKEVQATKPTVTPPTTKPARHRYPSPEAKTAPITRNQARSCRRSRIPNSVRCGTCRRIRRSGVGWRRQSSYVGISCVDGGVRRQRAIGFMLDHSG